MSRRFSWIGLVLLLATIPWLSSGCGETSCGLGTTKVGDQCVPLCPDDQYWDAASRGCRPIVECAPGTHLNTLNGRCEPDLTDCGAGTVEVNGECVPQCASDEYWSGSACLPVPECAEGTTFNPLTFECEPIIGDCATGTHLEDGLCVPDVICGPGTHAEDGNCVPDRLGEPDVYEGQENNDIFYPNWHPTLVNLPAEGDQVTLGGTVAAPTDLDGDGHADADYDAFILAAPGGASLAGSYLHLEATSEGACLPGLLILGVDDDWNAFYFRYALNPNSATTVRDLYLPADGTYFILVTDYNNLVNDAFGLEGLPVGGDDFTYFVTLEHRARPEPQSVSGFPYQQQLDLADSALRFFLLPDLASESIVRLLVRGAAAGGTSDVMPIAMLFGPDGQLLKEVVAYSLAEELEANYRALQPGQLTVVIDYLMTIGPARQLDLSADLLEVTDMNGRPSPYSSSLAAGRGELLRWDLQAGDMNLIGTEVDQGGGNLMLRVFNTDMDLLYEIDQGAAGAAESYFQFAGEDSPMFVEVAEVSAQAADYQLQHAIISTPRLDPGQHDGLPIQDMPEGTLPDSSVEHFQGSFGQMVFFLGFHPTGSWWSDPVEQVYTPDFQLMGPMIDASSGNLDTMSPTMAFLPADGYYFHIAWDAAADPAESPSGASYSIDFEVQDSVLGGNIEPGSSSSLTGQYVDTRSGLAFYVVAGAAGQALRLTATPDADLQPEIWLFQFGHIEGDGFWVPYYWQPDAADMQLGLVRRATADAAGEEASLATVFPYQGLMLVAVRDVNWRRDAGTYTIDLVGPPPPANDTCQSAQAITLSNGQAQEEGTTLGAASDIDESPCLPADYPPLGPDVFYSLDLQEGQRLQATFSGDFDGALYLLGQCGCPACCLTGADAAYAPPDEEETISYTVPAGAGGTYYLVVDSWSPLAAGDFTLDVVVE